MHGLSYRIYTPDCREIILDFFFVFFGYCFFGKSRASQIAFILSAFLVKVAQQITKVLTTSKMVNANMTKYNSWKYHLQYSRGNFFGRIVQRKYIRFFCILWIMLGEKAMCQKNIFYCQYFLLMVAHSYSDNKTVRYFVKFNPKHTFFGLSYLEKVMPQKNAF